MLKNLFIKILFVNLVLFSSLFGNFNESDFTSWREINTNSTNLFEHVAYGNGVFVAAAYTSSNNLYYSNDGLNWSVITVGLNFRDVRFLNGMFVGVGWAGIIATSTNGVNWSLTSISGWGSKSSYASTYGNGIYLVATDVGDFAKSSDGGATWSVETNATITGIKALAYGNNTFVATGYQDRVWYSSDATNWTEVTIPSSGIWYGGDLVYLNNKFVITSDTKIASSTDGINWTVSNSLGYVARSVAYAETIWIASGATQSIQTSTNLVNWTTRFSNLNYNLKGIAYDGKYTFVAVGENGGIFYKNVANLSLNLSNLNLSEHNTSAITLIGVNGIDNNITMSSANDINWSSRIVSDGNYTVRFDVNNSSIGKYAYYDSCNQRIVYDDNGSSCFDIEFILNSSLTIDVAYANWEYYTFGGNLLSNDKNVTDLMLTNSSYGLTYEANLSDGATSFDINFSELGEYNLTLLTDKNQTWYYNFTTAEINSTYIASSITLNDSNLSADLNLSQINFDDYIPPTYLNLSNTNLSEHNITNIQIYGVDGNSENIDLTTIVNGDNNYTFTISNLDNNYSLKFDVNNSGVIEDWYYNFSNGKIYPDNNLSSELKTEINSTNNLFTIDLTSSNWNYYSFSGNLLSNDKNVTDLMLINSTNGLTYETNLSDGVTSFDINFSELGEYNLTLVTDKNQTWFYNFTTAEINSTYIASSVTLNDSNLSADLNLSYMNFDDYIPPTYLNLSNTNLSEHNITSIKIYGVDGNSENMNLTTIVNGDNNYTFTISNLDNNYSLKFDVNNSGVIEDWYYNFSNGKIYPDNNGSDEFKTEINSLNNLFTINLTFSNWNYYSFSGNLLSNDKNVTDLMLINSTNGLTYEINLSDMASSFDINFSELGEYNLTLVTDKNQTWYYNFTTEEINSTYIASSVTLNDSNLSADLNLSQINFDDYIPPTYLNLSNTNLSEHNITNIQIYGVDGNSENIDLTTIVNGDNNYTFTISNLDNNYSLKFDVNNSGVIEDWYYNFSNGKIYPDNNGSDEFKTEINSLNNLFTINLTSSNWKYYNFSGNLLSNDKNVTDLMLINSTNGLTYETNLSDMASSFDINFSELGEYNLTLVTDKNQTWYYNFTTEEINSTYIASSVTLNDSNLSADLNLSYMNFDDYIPTVDLSLNLSNVNLIEHNITSIKIYGVDGNSEDVNFTTIANGDNNLTNILYNFDNNYSIELNVSENGIETNWYYNFSNGKLYPDNNLSNELKTEINTTNQTFTIDLTSSNWNYYSFGGNLLSNDKNVTDLMLINSTNGLTYEINLSDMASSFDINFSELGEYNLTLLTDKNQTWYYNFTTEEINSTYIASSITLNDSNLSADLNLSILSYEGYSLSLSSSNIGFGAISTGSSSSQILTVTNSGTIDIPITSSTLTSPFSISSTTCLTHLNPNSSCLFTLSYNPIVDGTHSDIFTINSTNITLNGSSSTLVTTTTYSSTTTTTESKPTSDGAIVLSNGVDFVLKEGVDNIAVSQNGDGTTIMDINYASDSSATVGINGDGSAGFSATNTNTNGEVVETKTNLPTGTIVSITKTGEVKQDFTSTDGNEVTLTTSKIGEVKLTVTTVNGESLELNAPAGTTLQVEQDGSAKQDYSTKDSKTALKMSKNGQSEVNVESKDGKVTMKSEIAGKTEIKENGGVKQSFKSGNNKISIEGNTQADSQAVIELPNVKLTLTPPKNGIVSVKKDGTVSIANDTVTTMGTVKSDMSVNPNTGQATVGVEIQSNQRGIAPKKIFYSTRKNISNAKLEIILDEQKTQSRAVDLTKSKAGRIKALFSTRGSFNFKEESLREVGSSSLGITPLSDSEFEENLYFDNSKELKLKSGSVNIKGFFSTRGSFSNKRKATNTDFSSSRRDFNMKSNSAVISENSVVATLNENNLKTDLQANSNGDLSVNITSFSNNKRGLKRVAKKLFYSVRKDFTNVKLEVLENSNQRDIKSPKVKTIFSTRGSFNFKSSNLRAMEDVEITPVDENTIFTENISEDGSRYIELISGEATINNEAMILNKSYQLPALELIELEEDLSINQEIKLELKKGWNLISTPITEDISDKFIFGEYELIWSFKDGVWTKNPNILEYQYGYWIKTNRENNLTFKGNSYAPNLKRITSTWALVGTGIKINDIENFMSEEKIEEIYQFKDNEWLKAKEIKSIEIGEAFWIKKIPADFTLNIKEGWNLVSLPINEAITDMSIFGDYEEILVYKNREWVKNPNKIEPRQGFWIKSNKNNSIAFYGKSYNLDINFLDSGWSLVGGVIEKDKLRENSIETIFLFKDSKWMDINSSKVNLIESGDGFWILRDR